MKYKFWNRGDYPAMAPPGPGYPEAYTNFWYNRLLPLSSVYWIQDAIVVSVRRRYRD